MKTCLITFRSVTPAQRAELALRRAGVDCNMRRTVKWMEEQGCGYSLHLRCADTANAVDLLRARGIHYGKVYRKTDNGAEEMEL